MRKLCCVVLALLPLSAFAYPIDVTKKIDGVSIDYTSSDVDGDISSIQLNNYGTQDAVCSVIFTNGPEAPRTRRTELQPGERKALTSKFKRDVIRLRIKLTCQPE